MWFDVCQCPFPIARTEIAREMWVTGAFRAACSMLASKVKPVGQLNLPGSEDAEIQSAMRMSFLPYIYIFINHLYYKCEVIPTMCVAAHCQEEPMKDFSWGSMADMGRSMSQAWWIG